MPEFDIPLLRLQNQHLAEPQFTEPSEIVKWMGAVQAQDYAGAKWAIGQRLRDCNDNLIEKAFSKGDIIRTHVMRPTWHFVAPEDVRWMLDLTAKRVRMHTATRLRFMELNDAIFNKCTDIITRLLEGGKQMARTEVAAALKQGGIATDEQRFIHIMLELELQQLVCSGGREGKQLTYALLDERVPKFPALNKDEALAALTERYFQSHGPATLPDYAWWSGQTLADCKIGVEMIKNKLAYRVVGKNTYWFNQQMMETSGRSQKAFLLPNYDEYIVSYKDRSAAIREKDISKADPRGTIFNYTFVINGKIEGLWERKLGSKLINIEFIPFRPLSKAATSALTTAAKRYAKFNGIKDLKLNI
jgi:hypothetical protein